MAALCSLKRMLGLLLACAGLLVSACDEPSPVQAPAVQKSTAGMTAVTFHVFRPGPFSPVQNATVSVFLNSTSAPTRLLTDAQGRATINVPQGTSLGYLVRSVPPEWLNFATFVAPPLNPGPFTPVPTNLGAVTCGPAGPVAFSRAQLTACVNNRYVTVQGTTHEIEMLLPLLPSRSIQIAGLNGGPVDGSAFAYLIVETDLFPWQTLPMGVKPGLLLAYGLSGTTFPGSGGFVEVYGTSNDGFEIAGTTPVGDGDTSTTVATAPVVCANPTAQPNVDFTLVKPSTNSVFSFTDGTNPAAIWAYGAVRGTTQALAKNLTTTTAVMKFQQVGGPVTVNVSQRMRTSSGTRTASVDVVCTGGICNVASAVYNIPGANNPLQARLYQPKPGVLYWVVRNIDPSATSEWAAKAFQGSTTLDQLPLASKSPNSSAFLLYSKAFTACHPDFSFDGGWGVDI